MRCRRALGTARGRLDAAQLDAATSTDGGMGAPLATPAGWSVHAPLATLAGWSVRAGGDFLKRHRRPRTCGLDGPRDGRSGIASGRPKLYCQLEPDGDGRGLPLTGDFSTAKAILEMHNELALQLLTEDEADEFADGLLETTGPPPPDLQYVRSVFRENAGLRWIRTQTFRRFETDEACMLTSPEQGEFLRLLIALLDATKVLDLGTFTGYSSTAMALASPRVAVTTVDCRDDEAMQVAREAWASTGVASRVHFVQNDALAALRSLAGQSFDMIFIDAGKESYAECYRAALELLREGGIVVIDDTLWSGRVGKAEYTDDDTTSIRALNEQLAAATGIVATLVPIHDGMTVAVKRNYTAGRRPDRGGHVLAGKVVAVEGNIAAGKTTLLRNLAKHHSDPAEPQLEVFYETPSARFLQLFYQDPARYGFCFQLHMLEKCQRLMGRASAHARRGGMSVMDRSPWGNARFADTNHRLGNLSKEEFDVYTEQFQSEALDVDVLVYLEVAPSVALERCRARGNDSESEMELGYLEELDTVHFEKLCEEVLARRIPVLVVDWYSFGSPEQVMELLAGIVGSTVQPATLRQTSSVPAGAEVLDHLGTEKLVEDLRRPDAASRLPQRCSMVRVYREEGDVYRNFKRAVLGLWSHGREVTFVNGDR